MGLLRHRLAVAIVAVAIAATACVLTFAHPQYRPAHAGPTLRFDEAKPPAHGWTWDDDTPGFHFGEHRDLWNISLLRPREVPAGVGILDAIRTRPGVRPALLFADGRCIGVQPHVGPRLRLCPPRAFAVVHAETAINHNIFVIGATRADVTRVVARTDGRSQAIYDRSQSRWWGAFENTSATADGWHLLLTFYGEQGTLGSLRIRFAKPGERTYCASALRAVCGSSAHRRS